MMNAMQYKGYLGSVEYDTNERLFYGKLLHIRSLVSYEATDTDGLNMAFQEAVEDYLSHCRQQRIQPAIPAALA
jgi:predicted HicB family RNase H-like nuclease